MASAQIELLKETVVKSLEDIKAQDIVVIDVSEKTNIADYMIIASGTSTRHLRALVDNAAVDVKKAGFEVAAKEGTAADDWVLIDLGDIILHAFMPEARTLYNLESLWMGARPSDDDPMYDIEED
ncbi:MAG: ribosome silencing factor [Saccharospirillaceae bacterium]|nr:ribosome silencing factor [Pseudomonadales bacterium]NRB79898.1 ribosome silencing factor [Saccharospirillaceae bacterium]